MQSVHTEYINVDRMKSTEWGCPPGGRAMIGTEANKESFVWVEAPGGRARLHGGVRGSPGSNEENLRTGMKLRGGCRRPC